MGNAVLKKWVCAGLLGAGAIGAFGCAHERDATSSTTTSEERRQTTSQTPATTQTPASTQGTGGSGTYDSNVPSERDRSRDSMGSERASPSELPNSGSSATGSDAAGTSSTGSDTGSGSKNSNPGW